MASMTMQQWLAYLRAEAVRVNAATEAIVRKGSQNMKDDARKHAAGANPTHARRFPSTISYDVRNLGARVEGEVGPTLGGQGSLGHILEAGRAEYGGTRNAPQRSLGRALDAEEPRFIAAMGLLGPLT